LEEVGHWLPQCSGLLTPVGSDEPFQAKNLSPCDLHYVQMTFIGRIFNVQNRIKRKWKTRDGFFGFLRSNRVGQRIARAFLLLFSLSLFNSFNKFATHHIPPCLKRQSESRCVEEVGHWLPQCSGLLTPVGSDEPFQAKNLSPCDLHYQNKQNILSKEL
jgi:hypothetical protein